MIKCIIRGCALVLLFLYSGVAFADLSITCTSDVDIKPSIRYGSSLNFTLGGSPASGGMISNVQWGYKFTGTGGGDWKQFNSASGQMMSTYLYTVGTYSVRAVAIVQTGRTGSTTETATYNFTIEPPDDVDVANAKPQVGGIPRASASLNNYCFFKIPVLCKGKPVGFLPPQLVILEDLTAQILWGAGLPPQFQQPGEGDGLTASGSKINDIRQYNSPPNNQRWLNLNPGQSFFTNTQQLYIVLSDGAGNTKPYKLKTPLKNKYIKVDNATWAATIQ